jgi:hypothetical protein
MSLSELGAVFAGACGGAVAMGVALLASAKAPGARAWGTALIVGGAVGFLVFMVVTH